MSDRFHSNVTSKLLGGSEVIVGIDRTEAVVSIDPSVNRVRISTSSNASDVGNRPELGTVEHSKTEGPGVWVWSSTAEGSAATTLTTEELMVGRRRLPDGREDYDPIVSREHLGLLVTEDGSLQVKNYSRNGTFVKAI